MGKHQTLYVIWNLAKSWVFSKLSLSPFLCHLYLKRHSFFLSYRIILPSSLRIVISKALIFLIYFPLLVKYGIIKHKTFLEILQGLGRIQTTYQNLAQSVALRLVFIKKKPHREIFSYSSLRDRLTLHRLTLCRKPQIFRLQRFLHCFSLLILAFSLFYLRQFSQIAFFDSKTLCYHQNCWFIVSADVISPSEFLTQKSLSMSF